MLIGGLQQFGVVVIDVSRDGHIRDISAISPPSSEQQ